MKQKNNFSKEWFEIPHMKLHRMDIKGYEENKEYLTDELMENIARLMSKSFMNYWEETLEEAKRTMINF